MRLRCMFPADRPEVLAIEEASFEHPWTDLDFRIAMRPNDGTCKVVEDDDEYVIGYMVYQLEKRAIEILNLAVARNWRRRGVGSRMIADLRGRLSHQRRSTCRMLVPEPGGNNSANLVALQFLRAVGFKATSLVKQPYEGSQEDEIVMEMRAGQTALREGFHATR